MTVYSAGAGSRNDACDAGVCGDVVAASRDVERGSGLVEHPAAEDATESVDATVAEHRCWTMIHNR